MQVYSSSGNPRSKVEKRFLTYNIQHSHVTCFDCGGGFFFSCPTESAPSLSWNSPSFLAGSCFLVSLTSSSSYKTYYLSSVVLVLKSHHVFWRGTLSIGIPDFSISGSKLQATVVATPTSLTSQTAPHLHPVAISLGDQKGPERYLFSILRLPRVSVPPLPQKPSTTPSSLLRNLTASTYICPYIYTCSDAITLPSINIITP